MLKTPKSIQTPARLLNIREAAAYLATTVHAVRQLQWKGLLPFLKIGKFVQFDRQDLDAFIAAQKTVA